MICDRELEKRLLLERAASGADRYDEVWEGLYIMSPMPNDEHQMLVGRLTRVLDELITDQGLGQVRPGINISDRLENWQQNYRVPDVAVFLNETAATNHQAFWLGGPDLAIEIVSPGDKTREKLEFYSEVSTRELLIIDRTPWRIEQYCQSPQGLRLTQTATQDNSEAVHIETAGVQMKLVPGEARPLLLVKHPLSGLHWTI